MFSKEQKDLMLSTARDVVSSCARNEKIIVNDALQNISDEPMGVFITLRKNEELRGCIGYVEGYKPLYEAIPEMSEAAATRDPRFDPVKEDEIEEINLEISLLSPLEKIESPEQVEVGKHGLVIKKGLNKGLLLPQVATENKWDSKTFLEHTCLKANLQPDSWKDEEIEIFVFSAEVFSEGSEY